MGFGIKLPKISLPAPVKQIGAGLSAINPYTQAAQIWTGKNPLGGMFGGGGGGPAGPDGNPYGGMPAYPGFESVRDASGNLQTKYQFDPSKSAAYQTLNTNANAAGPSVWANMQTERQKLEEQGLRDSAAKQGLSSISQGQSQLARTGGLSSGAAGLMASRGARDLMMRKQDIGRQGMMDRMGISSQDEAGKQDMLKNLANIQLDAERTNRMALLGDIEAGRQYNMGQYGNLASMWGAGRTADAQLALANQPKQGGGLLGMFGSFTGGGGMGGLFG